MKEMNEMSVRVTLMEEMLGTLPSNEEIFTTYIASQSPDFGETVEEEVAAINVVDAEKGVTVFPKVADGTPFVYDYQIRGFFKDSCGALARVKGTLSSGIKAYKKIIDGLIFVKDRQNLIDTHGMLLGYCERPLRGETPQGPRTALAKSECVPDGSTIDFTVTYLDKAHRNLIKEWLDYGQYRGLGQWRNSGKGKFTYEILDEKIVKDSKSEE